MIQTMTLVPLLDSLLIHPTIADTPQTIYIFGERASVAEICDMYSIPEDQQKTLALLLLNAQANHRVLIDSREQSRDVFLRHWIGQLGGVCVGKTSDFGATNSHKSEYIRDFYAENVKNLTIVVLGQMVYQPPMLWKV